MLAQGKTKGDKDNTTRNLSLSEPITKSTLRSLIPHLQRSSMLFTYGGGSKKKHESAQILLSCPLDLDHWTGEARLKPDISIFAPDLVQSSKRNKVERDMKQLFHNLLRAAAGGGGTSDLGNEGNRQIEGIVKATEGVIGIFFGFDDSLSKGE